jgi:hypothetical protein
MAEKKIIDVVGAAGAQGGGLVRANERKSFGIDVGVALTQVGSALVQLLFSTGKSFTVDGLRESSEKSSGRLRAEVRTVAYGHSDIAPAG